MAYCHIAIDDEEILTTARKFNDDITKASPAISIIRFEASRVDYSVQSTLQPEAMEARGESCVCHSPESGKSDYQVES